MKDYFSVSHSTARIKDFKRGFSASTIPIEIRKDRITGRVSRILPFRMHTLSPSHNLDLIKEAEKVCPFCPERLPFSTPMFPEEIDPEGRIRYGRSTVIPNAYPYCAWCGVTIFSSDHYIPLREIGVEILTDAFFASMEFFKRVRECDPDARFYSINWNYMPTAGGSLFHPHFQVVANHSPTHFCELLMRRSDEHIKRYSTNLWDDLVEFERSEGLRYIFSQGSVEFISSFSPGGIFGEILAVFKNARTVEDLDETVASDFLLGLEKIIFCFDELNMDCLNMTMLLGADPSPGFKVQARIMPRAIIPPWGTSDVNYFEKGHNERIVVLSPEHFAQDIRKII